MNKPTISVVIPAYNEGEHIKSVISAVQNIPQFKEVILVDDHSKPEFEKMYQNIEGITLLRHKEKNLGKTLAMNTGVEYASGDYILFLDADLTGLTQKHFIGFVESIGDNDVIRIARGADYGWAKFVGLTYVVGGEQLIRREILANNHDYFFKDSRWSFEPNLNEYVTKHKLKFAIVEFAGVNHILKMKKYDPITGFLHDMEFLIDGIIRKFKVFKFFGFYFSILKQIRERKIISGK
ncbi:MAG: glycosyltransferase family 2 protein [Candidatus Dojkabacteria bacterium]|nr:MAG: glycosyltransferase family 2 protein [Candidatus Dojkabacteria bacterium]